MKVNQLRIGNYVTDSIQTGAITVFNNDACVLKHKSGIVKCRISDLSPIPLTEEWLLKFGFKKSNVYCFGNHKLIIESLMGDRHSCRYRINPDESIWISELHYVHQLQNLYFALTGEELTFKSE